MIEIVDIKNFKFYRCRKGPFCVFFFQQNEGKVKNHENISLIKKLQSLEVKYKDIPLLGFNYNDFQIKYPTYAKSFLDILIIGKCLPSTLYEKPKLDFIPFILEEVRHKRYQMAAESNKDYRDYGKRFSMRAWVVKGPNNKPNPIIKCDSERIKRQNMLIGITNVEEITNTDLFISKSVSASINMSKNQDNVKWRRQVPSIKMRNEKMVEISKTSDKKDETLYNISYIKDNCNKLKSDQKTFDKLTKYNNDKISKSMNNIRSKFYKNHTVINNKVLIDHTSGKYLHSKISKTEKYSRYSKEDGTYKNELGSLQKYKSISFIDLKKDHKFFEPAFIENENLYTKVLQDNIQNYSPSNKIQFDKTKSPDILFSNITCDKGINYPCDLVQKETVNKILPEDNFNYSYKNSHDFNHSNSSSLSNKNLSNISSKSYTNSTQIHTSTCNSSSNEYKIPNIGLSSQNNNVSVNYDINPTTYHQKICDCNFQTIGNQKNTYNIQDSDTKYYVNDIKIEYYYKK